MIYMSSPLNQTVKNVMYQGDDDWGSSCQRGDVKLTFYRKGNSRPMLPLNRLLSLSSRTGSPRKLSLYV